MKASTAANAPQKHLHSRLSFLHQAAAYLTGVQQASQMIAVEKVRSDRAVVQSIDASPHDNSPESGSINPPHGSIRRPTTTVPLEAEISRSSAGSPGLACRLISHLQAVSLKGQIRLSPAIKHSICKKCHACLIPGSTVSSLIENQSGGGRKPWADVLVQMCHRCGTTKRFPVGMGRQRCRKDRAGRLSSNRTTAKAVGVGI